MGEIVRVLIVNTVGLKYEGITNVIISYLQAMDSSGLDIRVAGAEEIEPQIRNKIEKLGYTIVDLPSRRKRTFAYILELVKYIRKNKIQVIHAHGNSATLGIEMFVAWIAGCKKRIAHSHNTRCEQVVADKLLRPVFFTFYTDALACGKAAGKWLFKNRPFMVLTNGRDLEYFSFNKEARESIRNRYDLGDKLVIGHVGGFVEQKNHRFVAEIYREINRTDPDARLFMIGDGPLREEIEMQTKDMNVIFTGTIDGIADYLNAMDGMILPSFFEGLPLVALEWQINGLPCLLSDVITKECAITDTIEFMSLEYNADKWAKKVISMAKKNKRLESSVKAKEKVREAGFDITESAEILKKIYLRG